MLYDFGTVLPREGPPTAMPDAGEIIILADIEGSSGCFDRAGAQWLTRHWIEACHDMTLDVRAVVEALASVGVTVVDFHRTAFNLFADGLPAWVRLRQGYRAGVVPGVGKPPPANRAFFLGMHAAGGTAGVLAHTLTSQFVRLTVNDRPLAEIELFAGSLGACGMRPALFSGCPVACEQAQERIPGMLFCPVPDRPMSEEAKVAWRARLAGPLPADRSVPCALSLGRCQLGRNIHGNRFRQSLRPFAGDRLLSGLAGGFPAAGLASLQVDGQSGPGRRPYVVAILRGFGELTEIPLKHSYRVDATKF